MSLEGTVLAGKYRIVRQIGQGGMGAVYEAEHQVIGRRVAVKTLHPEYTQRDELVTRFHREAQAASRIGHVNIVEVLDYGTDAQGAPFLVMEFLEGRSLAGTLQRDGTFPVERSADVIGQTLAALQAAHTKGIIHRDLKPENILLIDHGGRTDFVKLLDFGISKFQTAFGEPKLTTTGVTLGTPYYMAPEQAAGESNLDHRVDVYAMGAVLYETLAGRPPYEGANYNALLVQILSTDPVPLREFRPDVEPALERVVRTAMARRRTDRFASAEAMLEALLPFGATRTPFERTGTGRRRAVEQRRPVAQLPTVPATDATGEGGRASRSASVPAGAADEGPDAKPRPSHDLVALGRTATPDGPPAASARRSRGAVKADPGSVAPTQQLDLTPSSRIDLAPADATAPAGGPSRVPWLALGLVLAALVGVFAWWRLSATAPQAGTATPATAAPAAPAAAPAAAPHAAPGASPSATTVAPTTPMLVPAAVRESGPLSPQHDAENAGAADEAATAADAATTPDAEPLPPAAAERDAGRRSRDAGRTAADAGVGSATPDAGRPDGRVLAGPRDARFLTTYEEEAP